MGGREETDTSVNTLIPLWDLANHDNGVLSTDYDPDTNQTVCMAHRGFGEGEQFTIFYGVLANCDLLIHNGFVFPDNQADCLTVKLGIAKTDPLANIRLQLLEKLQIHSHKFYINKSEEPLNDKLVAFLRILQMDQSQLEEYSKMDQESASKLLDMKVATQFDGKMLQYMITRCALLLRSYSTSMDQDQALMKETQDSKMRNNVQLRLYEKRILVSTVAVCEQKLKEVQSNN